jgi:hypothetical protein
MPTVLGGRRLPPHPKYPISGVMQKGLVPTSFPIQMIVSSFPSPLFKVMKALDRSGFPSLSIAAVKIPGTDGPT